ncbi:MAG: hypothetical protein Kow0047_31180 [Anaerolineae bacterium]
MRNNNGLPPEILKDIEDLFGPEPVDPFRPASTGTEMLADLPPIDFEIPMPEPAPVQPAQPEPLQQERPAWLCEVTGKPVPYSHCLACSAAREQPQCPFTPAILRALNRSREPDEGLETLKGISAATGWPVVRATSLTECQRKAWLTRHHGRPLERPSDHWARLRGVVFHEAMAGMAEGTMAERRVSTVVETSQGKAVVSGRVDDYDPERKWLMDYKTTSMSLNGNAATATGGSGLSLPLTRHIRQLHVYAWLLSRNGHPVERITVTYMTMKDIVTVDVPMPAAPDDPRPRSQRPQTLEEIGETVMRRLEAILAPEPPDPKPDEPWECRYCPFTDCPSWRGRAA